MVVFRFLIFTLLIVFITKQVNGQSKKYSVYNYHIIADGDERYTSILTGKIKRDLLKNDYLFYKDKIDELTFIIQYSIYKLNTNEYVVNYTFLKNVSYSLNIMLLMDIYFGFANHNTTVDSDLFFEKIDPIIDFVYGKSLLFLDGGMFFGSSSDEISELISSRFENFVITPLIESEKMRKSGDN